MAFDLANPIGTGTDQELLDFTRAAIAQITLQGQSYAQDGRSLTRADLPTLIEFERSLQARIGANSGRRRDNLACLQRAS